MSDLGQFIVKCFKVVDLLRLAATCLYNNDNINNNKDKNERLFCEDFSIEIGIFNQFDLLKDLGYEF